MTKMHILLISLIQAQPARIPKLVWGGAILILLIGISLLVYFFSRLKRGEKESEEDWSLARRSLFVEPSQSGEAHSAEAGSRLEAPEPEEAALTAGGVPAPQASDEQEELAPTTVMEVPEPSAPQPPALEREPDEPAMRPEPSVEERGTELLVSGQGRGEAPSEVEVFGDDVWAELDHTAVEVTSQQTVDARIEQRAAREPFEPPGIRPLVGREQFEPPRIDHLAPGGKQEREIQRETSLPAEQTQPQSSFLSEPVAEPSAISPGLGPKGASAERKPAGSVLGLPIESSKGPLILGEPSRPRDEEGIGALSNYGKETGPEAGRGGAIVLLLTIALVGGGILAYLYVPSVHAKVDSIIARLRGPGQTAESPAPLASGPRAQIFPARSEAVKNVVKARGTIYNTSSKPLEGLSLEIALERGGDTPPDIRTILIVPNRLEPRQQGRYEFEYDGSQNTGYPSGYRVTKLLSSEGEIKFATAGQPNSQ